MSEVGGWGCGRDGVEGVGDPGTGPANPLRSRAESQYLRHLGAPAPVAFPFRTICPFPVIECYFSYSPIPIRGPCLPNTWAIQARNELSYDGKSHLISDGGASEGTWLQAPECAIIWRWRFYCVLMFDMQTRPNRLHANALNHLICRTQLGHCWIVPCVRSDSVLRPLPLHLLLLFRASIVENSETFDSSSPASAQQLDSCALRRTQPCVVGPGSAGLWSLPWLIGPSEAS